MLAFSKMGRDEQRGEYFLLSVLYKRMGENPIMTQCLVKQSLPAFSILLSPYSQLLIQRELGVVTGPD